MSTGTRKAKLNKIELVLTKSTGQVVKSIIHQGFDGEHSEFLYDSLEQILLVIARRLKEAATEGGANR